jgi:hypothetical protein
VWAPGDDTGVDRRTIPRGRGPACGRLALRRGGIGRAIVYIRQCAPFISLRFFAAFARSLRRLSRKQINLGRFDVDNIAAWFERLAQRSGALQRLLDLFERHLTSRLVGRAVGRHIAT